MHFYILINCLQALHEDMHSTEGQITALSKHHRQLAPYLSAVGATEVNAQYESLTSRWQTMEETVIARTQQLSQALLQRQDFHDRWSDFEKWMSRAQKRHDAMREIYSDEVNDTGHKLEVSTTCHSAPAPPPYPPTLHYKLGFLIFNKSSQNKQRGLSENFITSYC